MTSETGNVSTVEEKATNIVRQKDERARSVVTTFQGDALGSGSGKEGSFEH